MSTATLPFSMPKRVGRKVRLLRWLVRLYVCLDGLAAIVLVLGVAFWLCLGIDWAFEPATIVRCMMWGVSLFAASYAAFRYFLGPISTRLSNTNLALLLERNFPELNQSVITTVEAADRCRSVPVGNEKLLQNTSREATTALRGLKLRQIFQFGPLLWKSGLATVLLLSIMLLALWQSEAFGFWLQRMQLSHQPWPRQVELSVVGFSETDGQRFVNVARDDDFELEVKASIRDGHLAPKQVEIRYRLEDGRRGRDLMTRIGEAIPGRDDDQLYRYRFNKVAADLKFDLVGGDDRLQNLELRVVERPQIFRMVLECEFPDYLQRPPQSIPISGRVELPEGSQVVCRIEASKSLETAAVHDPAQQIDLPTNIDAENDRQLSFEVTLEQEDRVLLLTMHDRDGVENREPYRIVLAVVPDQPPEVSVQLEGIGSAVTPQARIPFVGQVTDEYGLQEAWFEYQVDQQPPAERATASQPQGSRKLQDIGNFDLALNDTQTARPVVALKPGQQLTLSVKARDAYNLDQRNGPNADPTTNSGASDGQPIASSEQNDKSALGRAVTRHGQIGSSHRFMLEVVTNSELRALLEKKELALRQHFESIYEKMTGTRELLDRIDVNDKPNPASENNREDDRRLRERDNSRVNGALQNVVQLSFETLGVADGFEDIVGELVNNRVDSEELTERLEQGIAGPLREVGGELMPQLERQLQQLQAAISQVNAAQTALVETQAQGDVVLDAMKQVLDRMLELESYNELVELLRGITADQQKLQTETKQKRREKLRSLLED